MKNLPQVTIISLGGTISSTAAPTGLAAPRLSAGDLVATIPQVASIAEIGVVDLARLPSTDLGFALGRTVAKEIVSAVGRGSDGVVITQGTDTIEEMSFLLDLTVADDVPVVVTGAMRHSGQVGADGSANLLDAVRVAASPEARGLGCMVVLNGEVHSARTVTKSHTASPSAFSSGDFGPLGWIVEGVAQLRERSFRRLTIAVPEGAPIVRPPLVKIAFDDDGWWISGIDRHGAPGVVLEGMGGGHLPGSLSERVTALAQRIPVILTSRTGNGSVLTSTYGGFPGSETALIAGGVIPAGSLNGLQARVLLGVLLAAGSDRAEIVSVIDAAGRMGRLPTTPLREAE